MFYKDPEYIIFGLICLNLLLDVMSDIWFTPTKYFDIDILEGILLFAKKLQ